MRAAACGCARAAGPRRRRPRRPRSCERAARPRLRAHRHPLAVDGVAADRQRRSSPAARARDAEHERQVLLLDRARRRTGARARGGSRRPWRPPAGRRCRGRGGARCPGAARRRSPERSRTWCSSALTSVPPARAGAGVDDEAGRLVDHEQRARPRGRRAAGCPRARARPAPAAGTSTLDRLARPAARAEARAGPPSSRTCAGRDQRLERARGSSRQARARARRRGAGRRRRPPTISSVGLGRGGPPSGGRRRPACGAARQQHGRAQQQHDRDELRGREQRRRRRSRGPRRRGRTRSRSGPPSRARRRPARPGRGSACAAAARAGTTKIRKAAQRLVELGRVQRRVHGRADRARRVDVGEGDGPGHVGGPAVAAAGREAAEAADGLAEHDARRERRRPCASRRGRGAARTTRRPAGRRGGRRRRRRRSGRCDKSSRGLRW